MRIMIGFLMVLLSGCAAVQPFPYVARAGDTITLAVGSPEGMSRENTTVLYTSASGAAIDLSANMRAIIRLTPDKTSAAYQTSFARFIPNYSGHESWLSVIVIDLPPDIPSGAGHINVTTPARYPEMATNINDVLIPLQIVEGVVGSPHTFSYHELSAPGNLLDLEPLPNIVVQPVFEGQYAYELYGAAEISINMPGLEAVPDYAINVVPMDMDAATKSQTRMIWRRTGAQMHLLFVSPVGGMRYYEAGCSIVLLNGYDFEGIGTEISAIQFFDENGHAAAVSPTMRIVNN